MNAPESRIEIPTTAGTPFAGGLFVCRMFVGSTAYALIAAPKAEGEFTGVEWHEKRKAVAGAGSWNDGLANTAAMVEAGSKLAAQVRDLRIGGFDDWYLPSRAEALACFGELKDTLAGGPEAFEPGWYWTSTQYAGSASYAWCQDFGYGYQHYGAKVNQLRARAVRRLPIR